MKNLVLILGLLPAVVLLGKTACDPLNQPCVINGNKFPIIQNIPAGVSTLFQYKCTVKLKDNPPITPYYVTIQLTGTHVKKLTHKLIHMNGANKKTFRPSFTTEGYSKPGRIKFSETELSQFGTYYLRCTQ